MMTQFATQTGKIKQTHLKPLTSIQVWDLMEVCACCTSRNDRLG